MYAKGKKFFSTPLNVGSGSTSTSVSNIKSSWSERVVPLTRKKKKNFVQKIKRKNWIESEQSDSEWETQSSRDDNSNQKDEATPKLLESLERVPDLEVERDHVLSPPLISQRGKNTDSDDVPAVPTKSKKQCSIKRGCSSRKIPFPALVQERVYVPYNDDELSLKMAANKFTGRMGKWITKKTKSNDIPIAKKPKYDGIWSGVKLRASQEDSDLFDANSKRMTFNEFHARSKMKKKGESKGTGCLSRGTAMVGIQSVEELNVFVYKRTDGNFGIIKH